MDLAIKKRINQAQREKYKQYGYFNSGQTKEAADTFENLIASLNKINTDLVSLSIARDRFISKDEGDSGSLNELREYLNHANEAKRQINKSTFKTFLPNELDDIKKVYSSIESFVESIQGSIDFSNSDYEAELNDLQDEVNDAEEAFQDYGGDYEQEAADASAKLDDFKKEIKNKKKIASSDLFKQYLKSLQELQLFIQHKLLRNEGNVSEFAKTIGGGMNWINAHQGTDYI